jgi:hypothetical protein
MAMPQTGQWRIAGRRYDAECRAEEGAGDFIEKTSTICTAQKLIQINNDFGCRTRPLERPLATSRDVI